MQTKQRYTITEKPGKTRRRTAASHLRAAEIYAASTWRHPLLLVRRMSGEPQGDGAWQAFVSSTGIVLGSFMVEEATDHDTE